MAACKEPCEENPLNAFNVEECLDAMVTVAREAGHLILAALDTDIAIEEKASSTDLVTNTDKEVEDMIIARLKETVPGSCFIAEESISEGHHCKLTEKPTFIIDPIDGTTNFIHGFPYVAVSIALYLNMAPEIGVVYQPILDKMFIATRGNGAFCNKKKLKVSGQKDLHKSLIAAEHPQVQVEEQIEVSQKNIGSLIHAHVHGIRTLGSSVSHLCALAEGVVDAVFVYGLHCWDIAAAGLIVTEAGGLVLDTEGGPLDLMSRRVLAAGTHELADAIRHYLTQLELERD